MTEQGLCDMAGNLFEWLADEAHDDYTGAPADGSAWSSSNDVLLDREIRGGSWDQVPDYLHTTMKASFDGKFKANFVGIRLAR